MCVPNTDATFTVLRSHSDGFEPCTDYTMGVAAGDCDNLEFLRVGTVVVDSDMFMHMLLKQINVRTYCILK